MKKFHKLLLFIFLCFSISTSFSQESCKVLKAEIAEKYNGDCKKGLAQGKGVAVGKDTYVGQFKEGLPHGKGKYTWSTGEIYHGNWKGGLREGKGKYSFNNSGIDSVLYGFWENDLFVREILPDAYKVIRKTGVSRYSVRRLGDGNKVIFNIMKNGSPTSIYSNLYIFNSSGTNYNSGQKPSFEDVVFPAHFRATYRIPSALGTVLVDVEFEIDILEPGLWEISINN
jgi:hypothetical protein